MNRNLEFREDGSKEGGDMSRDLDTGLYASSIADDLNSLNMLGIDGDWYTHR